MRKIIFLIIILCGMLSVCQADEIREAPDGTYVAGDPQEAPDGTYVGGEPQEAPDGSYVGTHDGEE